MFKEKNLKNKLYKCCFLYVFIRTSRTYVVPVHNFSHMLAKYRISGFFGEECMTCVHVQIVLVSSSLGYFRSPGYYSFDVLPLQYSIFVCNLL